MRSSFVPLAAAGALALALSEAPPAQTAGGCCTIAAASRTEVFGEPRPGDAPATEAAERPVRAPEAAERPVPAPLDVSAEGLAIGETYGDVFRVLKEENTCSRF